MPNYQKSFESVISSTFFDGAANIVEGGTGTATAEFDGSNMTLDAGYDSNSFPSNVTFTGIEITISGNTTGTNASILQITPQIGATSGTTTNKSINANSTYIVGGSSSLLGLTLNSSALPFLRVKYNLFDANSTTTVISATTIIIHYTLPFSNKLYNTGGKLSITSGKVSLT